MEYAKCGKRTREEYDEPVTLFIVCEGTMLSISNELHLYKCSACGNIVRYESGDRERKKE